MRKLKLITTVILFIFIYSIFLYGQETGKDKKAIIITPAPTITVTYPVEGDNLEPGSYQTITWNKTGTQDAQVSIILMRDDEVHTLAASTDNDGVFTWQVPINLESAPNYVFRIKNLYMDVNGYSDPVSISAEGITYKWDFGDGGSSTKANPVHIYETPGPYKWTLDTTTENGLTCHKEGTINTGPKPTIVFSYPKANDNLEPGSYQTITWDKTGFQDARVRIKLMRNDAVALNLAGSTENDGSFTWQVPINLESASDYTFRIETLYMPLHGESNPVSITAKKITYEWDFGDGTQSTEANPVHIYETPGPYKWTLDATMENGLTCHREGTVIAGPKPTITFSYPGAGHNLEPGSYQTVTWNKTGFQDEKVRIKLMRGDALIQTLASDTENDGAFTWQVPINLESAPGYYFRIETLYMPVHGDGVPVSFAAGQITYKWDFGDGTQSTEANPKHTYETPGPYHWTLDTTTENGLTCQKKGTIDILSPYITINKPRQGDNLEPGYPYTITWSKTGPQAEWVKIDLQKNGTTIQTISERTENDGAFIWQVPRDQETGTGYTLRIETEDTAVTAGGASFDITVIPVAYQWNFGDGTAGSNEPNPRHVYTNTGEYTWKMTAVKGEETCEKTGTITVHPTPGITIDNPRQGENYEPGFPYIVTWTHIGRQAQWVKIELQKSGTTVQTISPRTENDGAFIWHVPRDLEPGTDYTLHIETEDGGVSSVGPVFSITATPVAYQWDFGDGSAVSTEPNPQHVYTNTGEYTWKMTAVKGEETCEKTGIITVHPTPGITIDNPRQGENYEPGFPYTVTWTHIGRQARWVKIELQKSGTTVQTISPRTENDNRFTWHVPRDLEPGTDYTLRIETEDGGVSSIGPVFSITATPVSYQWDFGDGTAGSNEPNPQHVYTNTGEYTWKMTAVKGEETCEKTGIITVHPTPDITITNPRQGENYEPGFPYTVTWTHIGRQAQWVKIELQKSGTTVQTISPRTENDGAFIWHVPRDLEPGTDYTLRIETEDSGVIATGESFSISTLPVSYQWDFGDGSALSNEPDPQHVYTTHGTYTWKMTATKGDETCQKTGTITVNPIPTVTFTYPRQGDNLEPGSYQTLTWNETSARDAQVKITLMRENTLVQTLASTTENDGAFTWQVPLNLDPATDYTFRIGALTTQYEVNSEPVSFIPTKITYNWNFGDGTYSTEANPIHIYAAPGTYHWTLDTTMNGITCQKKGTVTIQDAPTITFSYPKENNNLEPGSYQTLTWDKTGIQDARVRIKLMRNNTAALNLSDGTGNDGSFTWQVPINLEPAADYTFRIETLYMPLHGESKPVSITAGKITYKWNFGDGNTSTEANPIHIYENPGEYHWTLDTTMNGITCQKKGTVNTAPAPTITFSYPKAGDNLEPGSYQTLTWDKTGIQDARVRIKLMRKNTVALNLASSTENDGVFTWQVPINLESASDYVFRIETLYMPIHGDSRPVSLTAKKITYKWDFGDGNSSTEANPIHIYENPGEYHWSLDATMNGITCQKKGTVNTGPAPTITFSYPKAGDNLEPGSYQNITWDKTGFQDARVRIKLMRKNTAVLNLASSTENDGAFTWQVPTSLESAADYTFRIETLYMPLQGNSDPVSLTAKVFTYKWDFGDGNSSTEANPIHTYENPGEYHWTLDTTMDGKTCQKKGTVNTGPAPTIVFSYPQKGYNLEPGSYQTITWNKTGFQDARVRIKLKRGDTLVQTLSANTENDGAFTWQVPINLEPAEDYIFRIETLYMPVHGDSDPVSFVAKPITYKWDFGDNTQATGPNPKHIYTKPGIYDWKMEAEMDGITCISTGAVVFPGKYIMITYPKQGDNFFTGSLCTITWITSQIPDATVKIDLLKNGETVRTISPQTENDGSFDWTIPTGREPGTDYALFMETTDTHINRIGFRFSISKPAIPAAQRAALIALYNSTGGDNWTNNDGWKTAPLHTDGFAMPGTENTWHGITCNTENTTVIGVRMHHNNLVGTLPPELGDLTNLKSLHLYINELTGSIPGEFGNLKKLDQLTLARNQLSGSIPPQLGNLTTLRSINLSDNKLSGSIPPELGNLVNLISLNLYRNQLTGSIPPELGNLASLKSLHLHSNQLSGNIPPELADLADIQSVSFGDNKLSGTIPTELGNITSLEDLSLVSNQLSGSIPPELGNLTNLKSLKLSLNQLSGSIPPQLGNLLNLQTLYLYSNQLSGAIPPELGNLEKVVNFRLNDNQLTGNVPPALGNLTNLVILYLQGNQLQGEIPTTLTNLVKLRVGSPYIQYNSLYTENETLASFLNQKESGWASTQTIAPSDVSADVLTDNSIKVTWTPIPYTADKGGYLVYHSKTAGGPYTLSGTTIDKTVSSMTINDLSPGTTYYIAVQTRTEATANNNNIVDSEYSKEISVATTFTPIDHPDLNGDGKVDILWRNTALRENRVWLMDGTVKIESIILAPLTNRKWKMAGTGDFNGDQKSDILWWHSKKGKNIIWLLDGTVKAGQRRLDFMRDLKWRIVGTGDFNGDHKTDILWRNKTTGENLVWFMDGKVTTATQKLEPLADGNWKIVGTADFNGDLKTDILWRHNTKGENIVWFMDGTVKAGEKELAPQADPDWQIAGTGDFNGDKKVDILWRNKTNGKNLVWFMDGIVKTGKQKLEKLPDTNWKIYNSGD